jgi:hypothetical protein
VKRWFAGATGIVTSIAVLDLLVKLYAGRHYGLAMDNFLSMNPLEPLFRTGCAIVPIRMIKTGHRKLWIWFGLLSGAA